MNSACKLQRASWVKISALKTQFVHHHNNTSRQEVCKAIDSTPEEKANRAHHGQDDGFIFLPLLELLLYMPSYVSRHRETKP